MRISFLGQFSVPYSSESHHAIALESLGHEVVRLQEGQITEFDLWHQVMRSSLFIWIHTHGVHQWGIENTVASAKERKIPTLTYHLDLWLGLQRQSDMRGPYWNLDHFFTADANMANWLNSNTSVRGHYLPAGVHGPESYITTEGSPYTNDVVFVGSKQYHPEWPYRPRLINWLEATYGNRFTHIGGGSSVYSTLRGTDLNHLYGASKIVVGDTLCKDFSYENYLSDRIFETTGRGGFIIHPWIKGIDELFEEGKHIVTYKFGDFADLQNKIDYYLEHDDEREKIRIAGHAHTLAQHTYLIRWNTILEEVFR